MAQAQTRLPDRMIAYTEDAVLADSLARVADGCGCAMAEVMPGGLLAALADDAPDADLILIDIDDPDEGVEAISVLSARRPTRLVAVGRENDVRLYRRMMEAGAADYLVQPFNDDDLMAAIQVPAGKPLREGVPDVTGAPRVTVVLGCRGGVGTTGIAVSTAWWAAEKLGCQTALIDLDLTFGTAALALDLMPGRGLREALEHPERIDPLFIGSALVNATDNLFVLGAEDSPGLETMPAADGIVRLIESVAENIPATVVDLPRCLLPLSRDLLLRADTVALVSDLSLGGLRDAIRLKALVKESAPQAELILLAGKPSSGAPPVERSEFERAYEGAIDWCFPWEVRAAGEAASAGKPVVSKLRAKHDYVRAVADLAAHTIPQKDASDAKPKKARKWLW